MTDYAKARLERLRRDCDYCGGRGGSTGTSAAFGEQDADCGACDGTDATPTTRDPIQEEK